MKKQSILLKSIFAFAVLACIIAGCKKKEEPPIITPTTTCNDTIHSGFTLVAKDTCQDVAAADKLDGTLLEYKYDATSDSLWLLLTVNSITATQSIGASVLINFQDGSADFPYWGNANTTVWNRMVNVWVTGAAPSAYTGTIGVADAAGVSANNYNNLSQNNISIQVNTTDRTILLGLKRTDLIPDSKFTGNTVTVKAAAGVGANDGWNDDIYSATGSITITKNAPAVVIPTVVTTAASLIGTNTAVTGGDVTADGGAAVTLRGVVYSAFSNPTTSDLTVSNGSGTGSFSSSLAGLTQGTFYHVRAFATNSAGTAYGNEITFTTTVALLPTVSTSAISSFTFTTAGSGGNVTSDGGSAVTDRGIVVATHSGPTTADLKFPAGSGTGSFVSNATGLNANKLTHVRAYATNATGTAYGNEVVFTTADNCGSVTDLNGNTYNTVAIGTQCWTKENLRTFLYNDGTNIPWVTNNTAWSNMTTPAQTNYNNDNANTPIYGVLYNWFAVNTGKVCPAGWHVPAEAEWDGLLSYLGDGSASLKSTSSLWTPVNTGATNASFFSALPAGEHLADGSFQNLGFATFFWTSTSITSTTARAISMFGNDANAYHAGPSKKHGASIRCVKD